LAVAALHPVATDRDTDAQGKDYDHGR